MCGSRLFGLETELSDKDFIGFVGGQDAEIVTEDHPYQVKDGVFDYFLHRLDSCLSLDYCASPMIVPSYDSVFDYEDTSVKEFWAENSSALADISPNSTYRMTIETVEDFIGRGEDRYHKISVRLLGLIWCRFYVGNMLQAKFFPDFLRKRYYDAKNGTIGEREIKLMLEECETNTFRRYFSNCPRNQEIHDQYKKIIDTVLSKEEYK